MDAFNFNNQAGEAKLRYLDADYEVLRNGRYVTCAVTGKKIGLEDLRYWSVELQEPYFDAEASFDRWKQINGKA